MVIRMAKFPTIDEFAKSVAEKLLDDYEYNGKTIREWVEIILNEDFVNVVRCKDCKHYYHGTCVNDFALNLMRENDYCSYGERKCEE